METALSKYVALLNPQRHEPTKRTPWTNKDRAYLRKNYTARGGAHCAEYLGRSLSSVKKQAQRFGIASSRE